jgi:DNA-binding NarL/FixJ family response regulator
MERYVVMIRTDEDDQYITESTLAEIGNRVTVKYVHTIDDLDKLVAREGEPSVILLNDPGITHKSNHWLKQLKQQSPYAHIPVVVLGEVSTDEYVRECYRAGANTFITKPSSIAETKTKIETFFRYWFEVAAV